MTRRVAVIGGGISGLVLARSLQPAAQVTVFDKSRSVGGRMSTRSSPEGLQFDHGAKGIQVHDEKFLKWLQPYVGECVAPWEPRIKLFGGERKYSWSENHPKFVCQPKMTSLCKKLAQDCADVRLNTEICELIGSDKWTLKSTSGSVFPDYDWVISTAPQPQTIKLFHNLNFEHLESLGRVEISGCFALMIGVAGHSPVDFDMAFVANSIIDCIVVDSNKPGRDSNNSAYVVHTTSDVNIDEQPSVIAPQILQEFRRVTGLTDDLLYESCHRWRYNSAFKALSVTHLLDANSHLGVCGDLFIQGNVEGSFNSANALSHELLPFLA